MSNLPDLARIQFEYVQRDILSPLESNDLKIAAVPLSCVRLFDSTMMQSILMATNPNLFENWEIQDFGDLLHKFQVSGILAWEKGYAINTITRHLIVPHLKYNEPTIYCSANRAALRVYNDWLGRPVDNRSLFVNEELYHLASLKPGADLENKLESRLREYPHWIRDVAQCERAIQNLEKMLRQDEDLPVITDQVPALLGIIRRATQ